VIVTVADQPTDAQLVAQILTGDQPLYRLLVERHQNAVFNASYRLLGQREAAADVAQEVFLRAYQALASFQMDKPLAPWLCRMAINLSLNRLKQQRPTVSLDNDEAELMLELPDLSAEPQTRLLQAEREQALRQAILDLPLEQRVIIELRHFQEQSYQEIATQLNVSLPTVKSRLFRARQALRLMLEKEHSA
jgi:RNA polymerase sigma-70 factor (ECF subfamily)